MQKRGARTKKLSHLPWFSCASFVFHFHSKLNICPNGYPEFFHFDFLSVTGKILPGLLFVFFNSVIFLWWNLIKGTNMLWFWKILKLWMKILLRLYNNCLDEQLAVIVSIKLLVLYYASFYLLIVIFFCFNILSKYYMILSFALH